MNTGYSFNPSPLTDKIPFTNLGGSALTSRDTIASMVESALQTLGVCEAVVDELLSRLSGPVQDVEKALNGIPSGLFGQASEVSARVSRIREKLGQISGLVG